MSRVKAVAAVGLALTIAATPALADWREYLGKTLIVEAKTAGRTINDTITARGGASTNDDVSTNDCDITYHLYLSGKGRLFMHTTRIHCAGSDPYDFEEPSGSIYDLAQVNGMTEQGSSSPATPYSLRYELDEVVIEQPQVDYVWQGDGSVTTISNAKGSYAMRIRFSPECNLSADGEAAYRMEYRSTTSDYYTLQDTQWTSRLTTQSCRVVEGFVTK